MGNTCKPMALSFQCMTKFTTKKNNNNKLNIKEKKEKSFCNWLLDTDKNHIYDNFVCSLKLASIIIQHQTPALACLSFQWIQRTLVNILTCLLTIDMLVVRKDYLSPPP